MVTRAFVDELTFCWATFIPAVTMVVFFPGDEMTLGMLGELAEDLGSEDASIDDGGEDFVWSDF